MRQYNRPSRPLRYVSRDMPRRPAPRSVCGVSDVQPSPVPASAELATAHAAVSPPKNIKPKVISPSPQPATFGWEFIGSTNKKPSPETAKPKLDSKIKPEATRQLSAKVDSKTPSPKKIIKKSKKSGSRLIYSMAAVVFLVGVGVALQGLLLNKKSEDQAQALASMPNAPNNMPSEEAPKDSNYVGNYKVSAALPRAITIPSIGVKARVLQVGVNNDNQMQAPGSIFDTGWYTGASKPGEMGAAIINGHFSGPTKKGVFSKINNLKQGDVIEVERGDGVVISFTVQSTEKVPADKVDMAKLLVSNDTNKPGLNLITCGGAFDARSNTFLDRTIVYATRS